ncbi:unnamed protein product, partial [Meganyctiphanes norvegica]
LRLRGENHALWDYLPPHIEIFNTKDDLEPYKLYVDQIFSMEDLKFDCTLMPEPHREQEWSQPQHRFLEELDIQLKQNELNITIKRENQTQQMNVFSRRQEEEHESYGVCQGDAGICLTVINIQTSR